MKKNKETKGGLRQEEEDREKKMKTASVIT